MKENTKRYVKLSIILYIVILSVALVGTLAWFVFKQSATITTEENSKIVAGEYLLRSVIKLIKSNYERLLRTLDVIIRKLLIKVIIDYRVRHLRPSVEQVPPDYTRFIRSSHTHTLDKILLSLSLTYLRSENIFLGVAGNFSEHLTHLIIHKHYAGGAVVLVAGMQITLGIILIRPHLVGCNELLYRLK